MGWTYKLKFHGSSFLVASSWHPREDVARVGKCRRGCYDETASVEFKLNRAKAAAVFRGVILDLVFVLVVGYTTVLCSAQRAAACMLRSGLDALYHDDAWARRTYVRTTCGTSISPVPSALHDTSVYTAHSLPLHASHRTVYNTLTFCLNGRF